MGIHLVFKQQNKIVRVLLANWYVRFLKNRLNQVTEIEGLSDIRQFFLTRDEFRKRDFLKHFENIPRIKDGIKKCVSIQVLQHLMDA